ncbi:hypothetical protein ACOSQ3_007534 [Xanthoceras sorbifolium]
MNGDKQILREHDLTISGKSKILGSDPLSCPQYEDSHAVIVQNSTDLLHGPGVSHAEILMVVDGPEAVQNGGNLIHGWRFHFEEWLANDQDSEEIVSRMWRGNGAEDEVSLLLSKLRGCGQALSAWNKKKKQRLNNNMGEKRRRLATANAIAWDVDKIKACFSAADSEAILGFPLSLRQYKNFQFWHYNSSRSYSVNSGYWLVENSASSPGCSDSSTIRDWKFKGDNFLN